jgi:DegV family protein with EDD domain
MHIYLRGREEVQARDLKLSDLPPTVRDGLHPRVLPPTIAEYKRAIDRLGKRFNQIILILLLAHINPAFIQAQAAVRRADTSASIYLIDSQNIAIGLGLLVQQAARAAHQGRSAQEILERLRGLIPHIYSIFCVSSLTYLNHAGQLDPAQALIGEMLGIFPLYLLENGRLVPFQKARNTRHLIETFYEFVAEFNSLKHLALLQGIPPFTHEARNLYERILNEYPNTPYSEHTLGVPLAAIIGPHSLGLVAMEKVETR